MGHERWERRTDRPMLFLALLFVVVLVVPLVANLPPAVSTAFDVANVAA